MAPQGMRILAATQHPYLPQYKGGLETFTHDISLYLKERGHFPAVLASLSVDGWIGWISRLKMKLSPSNRFPKDEWLGYPVFRGWNPIDGIKQVVERFCPDVAFIQAAGSLELAKGFIEAGIKTVVYIHDAHFINNYADIGDVQFIANSHFIGDRLRQVHGLSCPVIPPFIRQQAYFCERHPKYLTFINTRLEKGLDTALAIAKARPDIPMLFVEGWALKRERLAELHDLFRSLPNVTFRRSVMDMREIYSETRILLAPSVVEEAWGRVASEAQICGIPVVARNIGGLPEAVGPGGRLIAASADIDEWIQAVSMLWDNQRHYNDASEAAYTHSRRPEFQPDYLVEKFVSIVSSFRNGSPVLQQPPGT